MAAPRIPPALAHQRSRRRFGVAAHPRVELLIKPAEALVLLESLGKLQQVLDPERPETKATPMRIEGEALQIRSRAAQSRQRVPHAAHQRVRLLGRFDAL